MGKGSSGQTVTSQSGPPPQVMAQYQNIMNTANKVADQPLAQYTGALVSGFTPQQQQAFGEIQNAQNEYAPYTNAASNLITQGATPISVPGGMSGDQIQNTMQSGLGNFDKAAGYISGAVNAANYNPADVTKYFNPYLDSAVKSTEAVQNEQDAQQQQNVIGNAVASGAWGGDRSAVAQGVLAGQQALANNQTIAGMENTGYNQAQQAQQAQAGLQAQTGLGAAGQSTSIGQAQEALAENQQQQQVGAQQASGWLAENAGNAMSGLGTAAQSNALSGANAELQSGALQQQLDQEKLNIPYEMFQQQQAYPYQTTNWLSQLATGLGSASGGTSSTTYPGASPISQIGGLGIAGLGAIGSAGGFAKGGRVRQGFDTGGITLPSIPNVDVDFPYGGVSMSQPASVGRMNSIPQAPQMQQQSGMSPQQAASAYNVGTGAYKLYNRLAGPDMGAYTPTSGFDYGAAGMSDAGANADAATGAVLNSPDSLISGLGLSDMTGAMGAADLMGSSAEAAGAAAAATDVGSLMEFLPLLAFKKGGRVGFDAGGATGTSSGSTSGSTAGSIDGFSNPADYVTSLYNNTLNRSPSANEVSYYTNLLATGYSPQQVQAFFANSPEAKSDIKTDYQQDLGRTPSQQETQYYSDAMAKGTSLNQVGNYMQASPEYQDVHQGNIGNWDVNPTSGFAAPQLKLNNTPTPSNMFNSDGSINTSSSGDYGWDGSAPPSKTYTPPAGPGSASFNALVNGNSSENKSGNSSGDTVTTTYTPNGVHKGGRIMGMMGSRPRSHRDMGGGLAESGLAATGTPDAFGGSPMQSGMAQQFGQMSPEQLQELAVRVPPNSPQGMMVRRVLQAKRMQPAGMAAGGRAGFDDGGGITAPIASGNPEMEAQPSVGFPGAQPVQGLGPIGDFLGSIPGRIYDQLTTPIAAQHGWAPFHGKDYYGAQTGTAPDVSLSTPDINVAKDAPMTDYGVRSDVGPSEVHLSTPNVLVTSNVDSNPSGYMAGFSPVQAAPLKDASPAPVKGQKVTAAPLRDMGGDDDTPVPQKAAARVDDVAPNVPVFDHNAHNVSTKTSPAAPPAAPAAVPQAGMGAPTRPPMPAYDPLSGYDESKVPQQQHLPDYAPPGGNSTKFTSSPWYPLVQAGLAMAAGKSPHALENIANGGLQGLSAMQVQRQQQEQEQDKVAQRQQQNAKIDQDNFNAQTQAKQFIANLNKSKFEADKETRQITDQEQQNDIANTHSAAELDLQKRGAARADAQLGIAQAAEKRAQETYDIVDAEKPQTATDGSVWRYNNDDQGWEQYDPAKNDYISRPGVVPDVPHKSGTVPDDTGKTGTPPKPASNRYQELKDAAGQPAGTFDRQTGRTYGKGERVPPDALADLPGITWTPQGWAARGNDGKLRLVKTSQ